MDISLYISIDVVYCK